MKMWASSWWKLRTRNMPLMAPEGSKRWTCPISATRKGELAVAVGVTFVVEHASWAVHRLDCKFAIFDFRCVHVFSVVFPVARCFPEVLSENLRSFDFSVVVFSVDDAPVLHEGVPDHHAARVDERHAGRFMLEGEEVELVCDDAVVPFFCFGKEGEIFLHLLAAWKGNPIDTCEHFVFCIRRASKLQMSLEV